MTRTILLTLIVSAFIATAMRAADAPPAQTPAKWVNISDPVVAKLKADGKKIDWPGETAGVTVDSASGDAYMIVPGQGIWKTTDRGATFARADTGQIGGRCETGYALNAGAEGKRIACFMLDGHAGITLHAGKTWRSFKDVGRNWDYAAVDWSQPDPKNIFAARHESGGEMYLSTDGGASWKQIGKDPKFAGVGIFDDHTLVTTKGAGILRSTDAGSTWAKASDLQPVGRVVRTYGGVAWWLGKEGLLVSTDHGATWTVRGTPVEASLGPWFQSDRHIMVAGKKGFFETVDAGQTWMPVAPLPEKFDVPMPGWFTNAGWDPVHDVLYASRMGKGTYKWERGK